jgi:hypothetical protein
MAQTLILVVIVLAILAAGAVLLVGYFGGQQGRKRELQETGVPTLKYEVPDGQDVANVLFTLGRSGYEAVSDPDTARQVVLVACPDGTAAAREQVREVLVRAGHVDGDAMNERPVRFLDE